MSTHERIAARPGDRLGSPLHAHALPFGDANAPSTGLVDVALLSPPRPCEPFVLRAPRGALTPGVLFGLRTLELGRMRLCLARALEVRRPVDLGYDLVGAHLVRPVADDPAPPARLGRDAGIATLDMETSIRLVTLVAPGETLRLLAPRGELRPGVYFGLRYFDEAGARGGIVRVDRVRSGAGLLDDVEGTLIGRPTPAPVRESYRAPFDLLFTAELVDAETRPLIARLTDLSAGGVGIDVNARLERGDRIRIEDPELPALNGAELSIVRRDRHEGRRHGARFVEPNRGLEVLATLLGLDGELAARPVLAVGDRGRSREAVATPLTPAEARDLLEQGIR